MKTLNPSDYLVKIFIRLEDRVDMFELSGNSLPAMISSVGGFFSVIFGVAKVIVYIFARHEFWGNLAESLLRTKPASATDQSKEE